MVEHNGTEGAAGGASNKRRLPLAVTCAGVALSAVSVFYGLALDRASEAYAQENGTGSPTMRVNTCDGGEAELSEQEARMVELHNEAREKEGLEFLCVEPRLGEAAQGHADDMIERDYFDHNSPPQGDSPGKGMEDRLKGAGYDGYADAGENIAWGSGESTAPDNRFDALMKSEGHRKNIMSDAYREVGIGYAEGTLESEGDAGVYVVNFGSMSADAPHERPEALPAPAGTTGGGTTGGPGETTAPKPETTAPKPETTEPPETTGGTTDGLGEPEPEEPEGEEPEGEEPETTGGGDPGGETMINEGTQITTENNDPDGGEGQDPSDDDNGGDFLGGGGGGEEGGLSLAEKMICQAFGDARERVGDKMGPDFLDPGYCGFGGDEGDKDEGDKGKGDKSKGDEDESPEPDEPGTTTPEGTVAPEETAPPEGTVAPEETAPPEEPIEPDGTTATEPSEERTPGSGETPGGGAAEGPREDARAGVR